MSLLDKMKETAQKGVDKTKEAVSAGQEKLEARKIENQIEELKARNIGASVHFIPIHLHPYYRDKYGYRPDDFPVAHANYQRLVSLPLNLRMSDADAADVIGAVRDIVATYRR